MFPGKIFVILSKRSWAILARIVLHRDRCKALQTCSFLLRAPAPARARFGVTDRKSGPSPLLFARFETNLSKMSSDWSPTSWQSKPTLQQPVYPDPRLLHEVVARLS